MFCDDVVCDNGEVFVPLFCLFDMFEAEKFPFKFKGKSLKKYISFASAPLFSLFREGGAFPASFPPPIKEREERGKPNEDTAPLEAKQKHPKPTLRASRYPHFSANSFVE